MKKELVSRIVSGLLGGIVICYLITIGISISLGNGNFYPCVPSLIKQFGNEITAVIVQTILSALLGLDLLQVLLYGKKMIGAF